MQLRGTLKDVLRDVNGNVIISFSIGKNVPEMANIDGKDLDIKVTQHREKRTLTQNAYYWVLIAKLAAKHRISNARLHNLLLRDVAPPFEIDGKIVMQPIPDTEKAENEVLEALTYHLKPSSGVIKGNDGDIYRWYVLLKGSSEMTTAEFTALLNRLVDECRESGIETLPAHELERMRKLAEEHERTEKR